MSISLNAQLLWTREQRHVEELTKLVEKGRVEDSRRLNEHVLNAQSLLSDLRGANGRGLVLSLETEFTRLLRWAREMEHWTSEKERMRHWLLNLPRDLPAELSEETQAILGEMNAEADPQQCLNSVRESAVSCWRLACKIFERKDSQAATFRAFLPLLPCGLLREVNSEIVAELELLSAQWKELMRYVVVAAPEWELTVPEHLAAKVWTVRIPPLAHLRAMWNLFWSALRHPLSNTTIDLSTGRVLYRT